MPLSLPTSPRPWSRRAFAALLGPALALGALASHAQAYPNKPITLVVPFAAGGPTDVVARTLGTLLGRQLGQTVIVENKVGAGGTVASALVARSAPDGYTLLLHHNGMSTAPALYRKMSFNPLTDFEYVSQVVDVPMTLLGRKDLPANNLQELMAWLKANPGKANLANAGLGAVSHLCGMLFQKAVGAEVTTVPFSGTAPAMNALLGGQVDILCDQTTQTTPHIKAGSVKLFGVTTKDRVRALPDAPTLAQQGLKDFEVVVWHGIYAPKGTPAAAIERFNAALHVALKDPAFVSRMADLGAEVVPESKQSPDGLKTWLTSEIAKWGPVIRAAGVYAD
ncbi:tripartite tricarboxylate transporter substrate-binding protein [Pseudorhodoferax sp. Leaf267]|uniref:tripartite tricarboxylate transporter substrate-binding protein n=1 Tax=Pseudorhodoferax sp. Leaf267 TaxID=1736316 RepID=UPI0006FEA90E|nr:tripartite tricarboxylate transporter substrate-binding protein [Pseudorhodoferax sp. Leaf267]KQP21497.1 ABC transporter substrate-binding protein [Pseudorhodoferax sp. Leaf267]